MIAAESRVVKVLISHQKALENMDIDSERNINCYLQFSLVVYLVIDANGRGLIFLGCLLLIGREAGCHILVCRHSFKMNFLRLTNFGIICYIPCLQYSTLKS